MGQKCFKFLLGEKQHLLRMKAGLHYKNWWKKWRILGLEPPPATEYQWKCWIMQLNRSSMVSTLYKMIPEGSSLGALEESWTTRNGIIGGAHQAYIEYRAIPQIGLRSHLQRGSREKYEQD